MSDYNLSEGRSVLSALRELVPARALRFGEALRLAELQATRLLAMMGAESAPVPNEIVTELPRIRVIIEDIPTSGMSYWDGQNWIITLNRREPTTRQRFTLFHEYKHIVDHGRTDRLYLGVRQTPSWEAERAADFFAGCVLIPRNLLKRAWAAGSQRTSELSMLFGVSGPAIEIRLKQVGLIDDPGRGNPPAFDASHRHGPRHYYRALATNWATVPSTEVSA